MSGRGGAAEPAGVIPAGFSLAELAAAAGQTRDGGARVTRLTVPDARIRVGVVDRLELRLDVIGRVDLQDRVAPAADVRPIRAGAAFAIAERWSLIGQVLVPLTLDNFAGELGARGGLAGRTPLGPTLLRASLLVEGSASEVRAPLVFGVELQPLDALALAFDVELNARLFPERSVVLDGVVGARYALTSTIAAFGAFRVNIAFGAPSYSAQVGLTLFFKPPGAAS